MILSILICSLPKRKGELDLLLSNLDDQRLGTGRPDEIEVLVDSNTFNTVGEKRNNLLQHAKGAYVTYIDDDDAVSPDYIYSILSALTTNPDCCSMRGIITFDGVQAKL